MPTKAQNKVWVFDDDNTPLKKKIIDVFFKIENIIQKIVISYAIH